MILDNRFWLMWLAPVVASFFSMDIHMGGYLIRHVLKVAFYGFLLFYLFYCLVDLIKYKGLVRGLKNAMLILSLSFAFIDFFTSYYFSMGFNQALVDTILATNPEESYAFFVSTVMPHLGIVVAYLLFCCLFLYGVRAHVQLSYRKSSLILALLIGGIVLHSMRTGWNLQQGVRGYVVNLEIAMRTTPIVKEIGTLVHAFQDRHQAQHIYQSFKEPYPKGYASIKPSSVANVILIVGESASRNFMGAYGYSVPNTPFLSSLLERERERKQNLFVFDNVISPFGNTMPVFQVLLNYSNYENRTVPWYEQKNLADIFKLAGYRTFWLDNQEESGSSNAYSLIARRFNRHVYTQISFKKLYDSALIDTFHTEIQSQVGVKNFILFHLIGSHLLYKERFPKSFAKFTPAQIPYQGLHVKNEADKQIVADYVNSLYYTDHVLEGIFKLFEDKDAVIIYLSDHAQDIFESDNTYGHRCSTYGVEIPFVIYVTDLFKQKHPDKVKQLAQAVHKPFMIDDLIHTLLPLAGIHTKDNLESRDLLNPDFDITRPRMYCQNMLYKKRP
ncbi:phosphoethanolamine transferase [Helicobacter salomonis]|uniref:phosphoethanolamine transferase n=2 Tax=Helicobacter salomonis TaxID=56878 RepID=UPI000CF1C590|nr:phosphoethanolamine transferase [Helicobacter salomonis]